MPLDPFPSLSLSLSLARARVRSGLRCFAVRPPALSLFYFSSISGTLGISLFAGDFPDIPEIPPDIPDFQDFQDFQACRSWPPFLELI